MEAILGLITSYVLPQIGSGGAALTGKVISSMIALYPLIKQQYTDLKPVVQNVMTAIRSDANTTQAQLDVLDKYEALLDADYDEAYALALAEDAAALEAGH